ncbi:hypothetical protein Ancab_038455 [Ancistrocladus abbreviatus]
MKSPPVVRMPCAIRKEQEEDERQRDGLEEFLLTTKIVISVGGAGIGVLCATVINYFTAKSPWGWWASLGCVVFPSLIMLIGRCFIADSSSSLVYWGELEEARNVPKKLHGEAGVKAELA